jgi:hypothetical protein
LAIIADAGLRTFDTLSSIDDSVAREVALKEIEFGVLAVMGSETPFHVTVEVLVTVTLAGKVRVIVLRELIGEKLMAQE